MRLLVLTLCTFLAACPSGDGPIPGGADRDGDGFESPQDCDDDDPDVHPDADERCDGADNDCDGVIDGGDVVDGATWYRDADDDGYGGDGDTAQVCVDLDGYAPRDGDCDDDDPDRFPGNAEVCDGVDNDCDGSAEGEQDDDADGVRACEDCDDEDEDRFPGNDEVCDGVDNDCDGDVGDDEMADMDIDGFPACVDCDDDNFEIYPGAPESCDGRDTSCSGEADVNGPGSELDGDGDGHLACAECDDTNPAVSPGIVEACDGLDTDCDGGANMGGEPEVDGDGDGGFSCDDCDDSDPTVYSGAPELCDGLDNDCDGATNFDAAGEIDDDNDGFPGCDDCDDFDPLSYPGAAEFCDGADNDCDGLVDIGDTAAEFDGAGDRIELPAIVPGGSFTVEAWVWFDTLIDNVGPVTRAVVHKAGSTGDDLLLQTTAAFELQGDLWLGGTSSAVGGGVTDMIWHHVAMTYDGAVQRLYLDGLEVAAVTDATGTSFDASGIWTLGARDDGGAWIAEHDGMIDDVRVWNVARTATEIDDFRCAPLDGTEAGLVAYLPLDTDFADLTGNGNGGAAVGDVSLVVF